MHVPSLDLLFKRPEGAAPAPAPQKNTRVRHANPPQEPQTRLFLAGKPISTAGNLTTDAHLAALAIGRGATLVSCDNDFARFGDLRLENPLSPSRRARKRR